MINIKGIDKAELLVELYNHSHQPSLGQSEPKDLTVNDARELLKQSTKFDYLYGKVMKIDLSNDEEFDEYSYDIYNGEGMAQLAVNEARKKVEEDKNKNDDELELYFDDGYYTGTDKINKKLVYNGLQKIYTKIKNNKELTKKEVAYYLMIKEIYYNEIIESQSIAALLDKIVSSRDVISDIDYSTDAANKYARDYCTNGWTDNYAKRLKTFRETFEEIDLNIDNIDLNNIGTIFDYETDDIVSNDDRILFEEEIDHLIDYNFPAGPSRK